MSRSIRQPYIKDKGGRNAHNIYRRKIKRRIRQAIKDISRLTDIESYELPNPKTLVNDYTWCDWWFDYNIPFKDYPLDKFYEDKKKIMRK